MKKKIQKYFIPNEGNDHRPYFLREKSVSILAYLIIALFLASVVGSYAVRNSSFLASIQSAFLVDLANEDRVSGGAHVLEMNERLVLAAQLKANDMAEKSYFAHTSPEGVTPWHWFEEAGYKYVYAGENLAVNFHRSEDVQKAWMNSPTHRANILNQRYKEIGIATAEGMYKGKRTTFVVQMFGTPSAEMLNVPALTASVGSATEEAPLTENQESEILVSNSLPARVEGEFTENTESLPLEDDIELNESLEVFSEEASIEELEENQSEDIFVGTTFAETVDVANEEQYLINQNNNDNQDEQIYYTNWFERLIVNPGEAVNKAYVVLFVLILFSLILKIFVSIRKQHTKNIAYAVILLILVLVFMYINQSMFDLPEVASI